MSTKSAQNFSLDQNQIQAFNSFYKTLPEKPATTIRLFNRGDFYTVHGQDAVFAAKEFFKTTSFLKTYSQSDDSLESITLNKAHFEAFVRELLLIRHYRVEVFFSKGGYKTNNWSLEYKASPGNLSQLEDVLFENITQVEGTSVIAVKLGSDVTAKTSVRLVGVALVDSMEQKMSLCEYADDEYFSNTETLIVQVAPKECLLVVENSQEMELLKKVIERSGIMVTQRKKSDFSTENLQQDMNRLVRFKDGQQANAMALPEMNFKNATSALSAIIKYLDLTSVQENFSQYTVETLQQSQFVHIDAAAVNALNIVPQPGVTQHNMHHSVFGLLDKCRTSHGHRLLMQWVRQPLKDLNMINERFDILQDLFEDTGTRQELYDEHLRRIPDLQSLSRRLQRKRSNLQDCYKIYQGVRKLPALLQTLHNCKSGNPCAVMKSVFINPLEGYIEDMSQFQNMIESTLDMTAVDKGEFLVKSEFDEELQEMRKEMDKIESKMKSQLSKVSQELGLQENKAIKLESNSQHGYFFRVSQKDFKLIQNNSEYTLLDTTKGNMKFTNNKLSRLNKEYSDIYKNYSKHQESLISEMINVAVSYTETLRCLSSLLATLDVLTSFAIVAACAPIPYVRPKVMPMGVGEFVLEKARHACVEMQDGVSFIPNDVTFKQGECTLNIITGPNMGGKSTYIRSVGVIALLAHIGSFVPCENAVIPVLDAILARVGANDSQIKGMSTFMVEMVETSSIIRRATSNSLVVIDELGRGTSTYEGCGIASAIVENLAKDLKSFTLFATHFHELTLLAEEIPTIQNLHVTAITTDDDRLVHLYQVKKGACDESFGIHVMKMAKFPPHVVHDAQRRLNELESLLIMEKVDLKEKDKLKMKQEAKAIIKKFLSRCEELKEKHLSDDEFQTVFDSLKKNVLNTNNPYISALLDGGV